MVGSLEDLDRLAAHRQPLSFHLKLNSGMNRLGLRVAELEQPEVFERVVKLLQRLEKNGHNCEGICTHLACGDEAPEKYSHRQLRAFQLMQANLEGALGKIFKWVHGLNSPAVLQKLGSHYPFNAFRPGIHLWGVREPDGPIDIAPVLQLRAPVRQLYWVAKGESVGYSRRYIADKDTRVGILNLGYADGLRRDAWSRNLSFYYQGQRAPFLGVVSMDMCAVDCSQLDFDLPLGAEFEWIGPQQSVETVALALGTIPYEIFTSLAARIERQVQ